MRRLSFISAALFAAFAPAAWGQSVGPVLGNGPGNIGPPFTFQSGHLSPAQTGTPAANAACGTGASVNGTDLAMIITSGTSTSAACFIAFAVPYNKRPVCNVDAQAASQPNFAVSYQGITLSGVADSTVYNVQCVSQPGG